MHSVFAEPNTYLNIILTDNMRDCQALQVAVRAGAQTLAGAAQALHSELQHIHLQRSTAPFLVAICGTTVRSVMSVANTELSQQQSS